MPTTPTPTLSAPRMAAAREQPRAGEQPLLHDFFDRAARRWPENIAIDAPPTSGRPGRRSITYAELKRQSDALALHLRDVVCQECVVAILLPRDAEHLYLAQLGVLKAGAAYTCIDPAFPDEQLVNILDDARAVALLTDTAGLVRVRPLSSTPRCLVNVPDWSQRLRGPVQQPTPPPWLTPSCLAYLIYTSGTTGRPKGVMIEHAGIANLVQGDLDTLEITPHDRVGQSASSAYDSSVEETWFALAVGATLVVMDDDTTRLGPDLIDWLRNEAVTMFCPSPTLLRATGCDDPQQTLPHLRLIHVGGEALPTDVADRWAPGRCLINDYGPTECTVTALRGRIEPGAAITIGSPVPGLRAWVLNDRLEEVAAGEQGELCLGGVGLARGYRNQPQLTAQKFPYHPLLGRIYRTGDLVHRDAAGNYYCHGRIDAQVKVRGYRIELEAIEARLVECPGVREAACRVQGEGGRQQIVAFVVPEPGVTPCFEDLKHALHKVLPEYMVPGLFGLLAKLPTTVSGKLNRKELPVLELHSPEGNGQVVLPRTPVEEALAAAFRTTLGLAERVSIHHDFFNDLSGNSLLAAQLISRLRGDAATSGLTVRDLYETRTVAELARRARVAAETRTAVAEDRNRPVGRPFVATCVQTLWLLLGLVVAAPIPYLVAFQLLPALTDHLELLPLLLLTPLLYAAGLLLYTGLTVGLAVLAKKLLIGRYQPLSAPIWGSYYVRNWMVLQVVRRVPWRLLQGTEFQNVVLRALGARIGRRVHIHRGVNLLQGGWDLLDLGDDVTLSQDAALQLVEYEDGQMLVGPVTVESGSTLETRAGVGTHTHLEADSYLTSLSFLPRGGRIPRGERWDGVPAKPVGQAPEAPTLPENAGALSPVTYGFALALGRLALGAFETLPVLALAYVFAMLQGLDPESALDWLYHPSFDLQELLLGVALVMLTPPLTLLCQAIALRLLGRIVPGVVNRWSLAYVRVWLKAGVVEAANQWLTGTLLWPYWLRLAGMKIGRGCEVSSIIDTIPEMVEMGPSSFLADGIYLAGPKVHRGTVTLAPVRLGANTYFGNNVLIASGQTVPDGVLLGVSTVADDTKLRPNTSWFGHPPFELPRREVVEVPAGYQRVPLWLRYVNRVCWELLRFALPLASLLIVLGWFALLAHAEETVSLPVLLLGVVPLLDLGVLTILCLLGLILKWALLGRVKPAVHPLLSCWCSRWEFHYIAYEFYSATPLSALEGTLLLNWYLRAMGMRLGRQVFLGTGFAYVIDHDMLTFEDGATVNCMFQAHTFEDRVLKIDRVRIRRQSTVGNAAVLLYGADIGVRTSVLPHSVVMKHEHLLPGHSYAGCPTHLDS